MFSDKTIDGGSDTSGVIGSMSRLWLTKHCPPNWKDQQSQNSCTDFCRASVHRRAILIYQFCLSVRPSVRNVSVLDENGLTYRHSFSPHGGPIILVLPASNIFTKLWRSHPCAGAKYRCGIKNSRFSTNKSLSLANDTRYRHSYYGRRIGTRTRSIKWCHFQWPWTNTSPVFKVTPLFDAKYLTNGYRYYRRRIGNRTQAWMVPVSMTLSDIWARFQGHGIIQRQNNMEWRINRKSYMVYRTAPFSMTLNDSKPRFQGLAILRRWTSPKRLQIRP